MYTVYIWFWPTLVIYLKCSIGTLHKCESGEDKSEGALSLKLLRKKKCKAHYMGSILLAS
jgi:hypothetical protein